MSRDQRNVFCYSFGGVGGVGGDQENLAWRVFGRKLWVSLTLSFYLIPLVGDKVIKPMTSCKIQAATERDDLVLCFVKSQ